MYSAEKQAESWSVTRELEGCQSLRKAEKLSQQKSQQSALPLPSCSHDFLRMLRCLCSPRREQTGSFHCASPVPREVLAGPPHLLPQQLFWRRLLSPWHRVTLQRPHALPSLWARGGLGSPPTFVCLPLAKPSFSALSALSLTLALLVA